MLFDSPIFVLFLLLVVVIYWQLRFEAQNRFLLAVSYLFYGWWDWRFLLLMIGSTLVDYWIAIKIADASTGARSRTVADQVAIAILRE